MQTPADREPKRTGQQRRARPVVVRTQPGLENEELAKLSPRAQLAQLPPLLVSRLQGQVGNNAVSRLVVQRRELSSPEADPKFRALTSDVRGKQKRLSAHPPAKAEAAKAAKAAKAPPDDKQAHAKAAQADKMNAAKPGEFNKAAFIAAVNEAINKQAPKNLSEARDYGESGKANAIKGEVAGKVTAGKKASAAPVESATKAAPDTSKIKDKPVTPLTPDKPPGTPGTPNPAQAVPDKAPPADTDFSAGPKQVDGEMAEAGVTEEQLAKSNEPEFTGALEAKKEGEEHSATAPQEIRAHEAETLGAAKSDAAATGATSMASMAVTRKVLGASVASGKQGARTADELKRAKVAGILQKVFDATKAEVEVILNGIDAKVDAKFDSGEKAARDAFTAEHSKNMKAYKKRRYSGVRGKYRWVRDKFKGLPSEANKIFDVARQGYVNRMKRVIASVAEVIAGELNRAKARIARGRQELQAEVSKLPKDLKALGKKAAGEFAEKFDELTESVDDKGSELVQTLASKYKDALGKVDEEIEAEKEKNSGLIARAINAIKGVIKAILELKDLLLGVLAKAAEAALAIISDPIGFLGNLVSQVGAGLSAFMGKLDEHLKKGLVSWLLGSAGSMGIEIPKKLDLAGIIGMVAGMLGLTWDSIKARVISRGIPAKVLELAEGSLPLIAKLRSEGIGGIWEMIVEKVGDIKETLFTKISEYLVPEVLKAGIVWILSLLNPASAFIKACKMIVDIVTFIVTRGKQIIEFVHAVLDAVIAIAKGAASGVPALIENALSKSIPVLIGALASILGVTGIADNVKKIIQGLSKPIMKAIDWVTDKIVGVGKTIWGKLKSAGAKIKAKAKAVGAKITAKAKAVGAKITAKAKAGYAKVKAKFTGGKKGEKVKPARVEETPAQKEGRLKAAVRDVEGLMTKRVRLGLILGLQLRLIKRRHKLTELRATKQGAFNTWDVTAKVNPEAKFQLFSIKDDALALRNAVALAAKKLSPKAELAEIQALCAKAAQAHLAAGHKLTWDAKRDSWILNLERPERKPAEFPRTAVGMFTKATEFTMVRQVGQQTLYTNSAGQEYCDDAIGQKVPRFITRRITPDDLKSIRKKKGIQSTGPTARTTMPQHVEGKKPSPFISTTKELGGITNAQGKPLGKHGRVRIDLLQISPKVIFDLTTRKAQDMWNFSDPQSNVARQALEDVVRTQEVLVKGEIPQKAIELLD